ncbi:hypothetical protein [Bacillus solimangrovi]|uniref:Uncharacterized protein n=1 Tax=Bacillus solimangrovi TaxID=1305675 RepID=A0A1E5LCD7_9BACI|nr:hypothetical protein [Bacillus solimangrovi]OEH91746.1 hypothetical protein BFG57_17740 [Bacillus solimangrovi]
MSIQSRFMPHTHIHEQKFDNEELKIIDYIEKSKSQLRNSFLKNIQSGRDGILKRLIASIIRENILGLRNSEIIIHKENGKWGEQHACPTSVMKHLQAEATLYETYTEISALFLHNNDAYLVIPINKRYAFGRVEVNTPISIIMKDGYSKRISHSVEILELLVKEGWEGDQEAIDVFKHDLTNSSANLTFAYAHYE